MAPNPKIVFFDVGNVFMTYDRVFDKVLSDLKIDRQLLEKEYEPYDLDANLGKIKIPEVWSHVCQKLEIKEGVGYDIVKSWVSDYQAIEASHQLVYELDGKYQMGIISNYYHDFFGVALKQGFIPNVHFSPVIISAEVGVMKPDRKIYEIAETESGYSGQDILFVDDKMENLTVAKTLNWQVFHFDYKNPQPSVEKIKEQLLTS